MSDKPVEEMDLVDLMDAMAPLEAPDAIPIWPLQPGWWWLLAALVGLVVAIVILRRYRRFRERYRLQALSEVQQLSLSSAPTEVSAILKRYVLTQFPRHEVASLSGSEWGEFLSAHSPSHLKFDNFYTTTESLSQLQDKAQKWLQEFKGAEHAV